MIRSTLNSIPNHVMQFCSLPKYIMHHLKRYQRDFLWGSNTTKRRLHLVNWKTVTTPKHEGGLGIQDLQTKNQALLAGTA